MTAHEQLAAAHQRMTPDEIAANALDLADAVELLAGALIDPSKDRLSAKVIPVAAGINRQQRRAAERAARKVRAA